MNLDFRPPHHLLFMLESRLGLHHLLYIGSSHDLLYNNSSLHVCQVVFWV